MRYTTLLISLGLLGSFTQLSTKVTACCDTSSDADSDTYCPPEDCDDTDGNVYPGAPETCDGKDNDCDDLIDNADPDAVGLNTYYLDEDGDGYGAASTTVLACSPPAGYVVLTGDCAPRDPASYPGATEQCDGLDNNCDNSLPPEEQDQDLDGQALCAGDCNDTVASIHDGATETCDGVDQDCDGLADVQGDGSGGWQHTVCGAVLTGTSGSYDSVGTDQADVSWNASLQRFEAWYRVIDSSKVYRLAFASSKDGHSWSKSSGPVLSPGASTSWDSKALSFPSVLQVQGGYVMWYHASDNANKLSIGRATSADGLTWTKEPASPVFTPSASGWDMKGVSSPSVLFDTNTSTFKMWYAGSDGTSLQTGYAESPDGITWSRRTSPVLSVGGTGTWDSKRVVFARVLQVDGLYMAYYSGDDISATFSYEIGYAWSMDGISWIKLEDPLLSWDAQNVMAYASDVLQTSEGYWMFYSQASTLDGPYAIYLAKNDVPDASLLSPAPVSSVRLGEPVRVTVEVYDRGLEDPLRIHVFSDLDGQVASKSLDPFAPEDATLTLTGLSSGLHTLKVLILDAAGLPSVLTSTVMVK